MAAYLISIPTMSRKQRAPPGPVRRALCVQDKCSMLLAWHGLRAKQDFFTAVIGRLSIASKALSIASKRMLRLASPQISAEAASMHAEP